MVDLLVIGGGAAGFFGAIHVAAANPGKSVVILEKAGDVLSKVRISGGGRCNVTHAVFDPAGLSAFYPRGERELLGPFHHFCTGDTMAFFQDRGVPLKVEDDGRIFPESDNSQSIIDCLLSEAERLGIQIHRRSAVTSLEPPDPGGTGEGKFWKVTTTNKTFQARTILLAAGSSNKIWQILQGLGHTIVPPVPSLFTFNIEDPRISGIPGVATPARVSVPQKKNTRITVDLKSRYEPPPAFEAEGPLLITHWGLSGPAVLKLSSWGARYLNGLNYKFQVCVNWLPDYHSGAVVSLLKDIKEVEGKKTVWRTQALNLPKRLWVRLAEASGISKQCRWADLSRNQLDSLGAQLVRSEFSVNGKSTFKEEFVTAGGVSLKEVDFRTFESKLIPSLFMAGEILDIDALTGGFNFQNAWTGGYLAARGITAAWEKD